MSYPPDPNNPYGQPQQPNPYGQQPAQPQSPYGQQPPQQPGYGYPQQPPTDPYGQQQAPGYDQPPPYGYDPYANQALTPNAYANWGTRVVAYIVDSIIIGIIPGILDIANASTAKAATCTTNPTTYAVSCTGGSSFGILGALAILIGLAGFLYFCYMEGTTGQTVGKKMVNITLVREQDGQPIGFGLAVVRKIAHVLDSIVCCVGYLWPLWDAKKQTFADKIMTTVVVKKQ